MTCLRKKGMTTEEAPYRIEFQRNQRWSVNQAQMLWLAAVDSPTTGFFINGRTQVFDREGKRPPEDTIWYRFTDENTAFFFKLQFG